MKPRISTQQRLHQTTVPLLGLTGGIASGKSTVASLLTEADIPVISADTLIKQLYERVETKDFILQNFPECIASGAIDFPLLRQKTFQDNSVRSTLENFLHPRLPEVFKEGIQKLRPSKLVVYDIPLLFEKSLEQQFDLVVCVYCHPDKQKERLLARDDIDKDLALAMLKGQMDIEIKRKKADVVIDNSGSLEQLSDRVQDFIKQYL